MQRIVDETRPEAIIHTAAISDMGACQRDPEGSRHANVEIPLMLAKAARGARLVMFSTDQVYNGNGNPGPYREDELISPVNVYARHKAEMEQRVLELRPDAVMLRATWMYDMPLYRGDNRGNFLMNIIKASLAGRPTAWSKQEFRGITYVREAAEKRWNPCFCRAASTTLAVKPPWPCMKPRNPCCASLGYRANRRNPAHAGTFGWMAVSCAGTALPSKRWKRASRNASGIMA